MEKFKDTTVISFGFHRGKRLADIPASWFIYMYDQIGFDKQSPLGIYITENIEAMRKKDKADKLEQKRQNKLYRR